MSFVLRMYDVEVEGYGSSVSFAKTAASARYQAWRSFLEPYPDLPFLEFLQKCKARLSTMPAPAGFGRPVVVLGKPAHFVVKSEESNRVYFVYDGQDLMLPVHPSDVIEVVA